MISCGSGLPASDMWWSNSQGVRWEAWKDTPCHSAEPLAELSCLYEVIVVLVLRNYKPSETLLAGQAPLLKASLKCKPGLSADPLHLSLHDKCFTLAADPLGVGLADRLILLIAGCLFAFVAVYPLLAPICFLQPSQCRPQLCPEINQCRSAHWRVREGCTSVCFHKELPWDGPVGWGWDSEALSSLLYLWRLQGRALTCQ